jgi:hypothetical protein
MKGLSKALGLALLVGGLYVLGKDIIFTTRLGYGFWGGIAALCPVLALVGGTLLLLFAPKAMQKTGWVAIVVGVVLVFAGSRAVLNPVSLWQFLIAFACMAGGYKLMIRESSPYVSG